MLTELEKQSYPLLYGKARLYLRYDMTAFLSIEKSGYKYTDIFAEKISGKALTAFLHAGLNEDIGAEREVAIVQSNASELWKHCKNAMVLALPVVDPLVIPPMERSSGEIDFTRLFTLVVDVMKRDESFFWTSTLRELVQRWQGYAVAKGYQKPAEKIELYDTEGM